MTDKALEIARGERLRRVSVWIMAAVIVLSVLLGTVRSLSSLRKRAEAEFYRDMGIAADLSERSEQAYNLVTVAEKYLAPAAPETEAVLSARDALNAAESISEKYDCNQRLTEATKTLGAALTGLSEKDAASVSRIMAELSSRNSTISHDSYNESAEKFNNKALGGFPSRLIGGLFGVRELELFR